MSPAGDSVYTTGFDPNNTDGEIAEFTRSSNGSLAQPASPGDCVERQGDNLGCGATAIGMTGITGLVISPDGRNVYTASEQLLGPIAEFVYIHGQLVPLTELEHIGPGVTIDSRHGTFELTTAGGAAGTAHDATAKGKPAKAQTGQFGGAVVRIRQTTRGANRGLTTVMMVLSAFKGAPSQAICGGQSADGHAAASSSKTIQLLHATAHGKFSTQHELPVQRRDRPRHKLDDDRPLRRHPHARHQRQRRRHRLRPAQDDHPPRRPELPRSRPPKAIAPGRHAEAG